MGVRQMRITGEAFMRLCRDGQPRSIEIVENGLPHDVRLVGIVTPEGRVTREVLIVVSSDEWIQHDEGDALPELKPTTFRVWSVPDDTKVQA